MKEEKAVQKEKTVMVPIFLYKFFDAEREKYKWVRVCPDNLFTKLFWRFIRVKINPHKVLRTKEELREIENEYEGYNNQLTKSFDKMRKEKE